MKHRLKMHNPPHPAETLREDILPALGISVTQAAKQLGVSRVTLSRLLNGKTGISADMAIRLHAWLGDNSPAPKAGYTSKPIMIYGNPKRAAQNHPRLRMIRNMKTPSPPQTIKAGVTPPNNAQNTLRQPEMAAFSLRDQTIRLRT